MRKLIAGLLLQVVQALYPHATKAEIQVHEQIGNLAKAMLGDQ